MKSDGLSPDVYSYAGCIDACAKAAQWKKACQILGQMREAGVEVGKRFSAAALFSIPVARKVLCEILSAVFLWWAGSRRQCRACVSFPNFLEVPKLIMQQAGWWAQRVGTIYPTYSSRVPSHPRENPV